MGCTFSDMYPMKESRQGFVSKIYFKCRVCNTIEFVSTDDEDVTSNIILGCMTSGSGYSQLKQIIAAANMPTLTYKTYKSKHDKICIEWKNVANESMKAAAEEEKQLAINRGNVNKNGIPMISVVCDGTWAKRSYRRNYNSLSGAACIVGFETKKVLFISTRNKYCSICKAAERLDRIPRRHACFKNWTGHSTAMESDIILEGFKKSIEDYGIIYKYMIADGDSSCYKKILDNKPYGEEIVKKIECRNHILRNYSNKIIELTKDTKSGPLHLRNKIKENILRFRGAVTKASEYRRKDLSTEEEKITFLKSDIINSLRHILGNHENCQNYFCKTVSMVEENFYTLENTDIYEKLVKLSENVSKHASSLLHNKDSNYAEVFNSIVAKYIGRKRINYCKNGSYEGRCHGAVLAYNDKTVFKHVMARLHKKTFLINTF